MRDKKVFLRRLVAAAVMSLFLGIGLAAELTPIPLKAPDKKRGLPLMEALSLRASATEYAERDLSTQDLSDLLWAACGINRPDSKKTTAPSAMNSQDIDVYVLTQAGAYRYDAAGHLLEPIVAGDLRSQIARVRPPRPAVVPGSAATPPTPPAPPVAGVPGVPAAPAAPGVPGVPGAGGVPRQPENPPVQLLLVSETARFRFGTPESKAEMAAYDAGIVSQNISLFCAATGLRTRPKASIDKDKFRTLLKLTETQRVMLNHPVGYAK